MMLATLFLLPEQCEPMDEFMTVMHYVNQEIENRRATEAFGTGYLYNDILEEHCFILEELLYPLLAATDPNQLKVRHHPLYIAVELT